ncbi:hypothetical protein ABFV05_007570 [Capra hircus]
MCAQSPFWSLLLSALKGPALFITDQLIPAGRPGRGELGSPQGLGLGWAAKGSRASPGRWRRELRARRMCWRVSRGARPKGRRLYRSGLLGCLRPGAPALELPHTVSVFGLQLSCSGKVDSEVMILNAAQLDRSDPLTLKGRMTCWCEKDGRISGSWQFGFNGEMCLHFDSENGHWTVDHSGGRQIKEKWANNRAMTDFFKKVSMETVGPGFGSLCITNHSTPYSTAHGPSQQSHNRDCSSLCFRHNKLRSLNQEQEAVLPGSLTGALLASGLSLCLAAFVLLLITLEPGDETSGIPSLSASYADTVAAPSRVSCRI